MYSPLDRSKSQIRLLRLLPSDDMSDSIMCELFTVSLDESNTYEALSYVWGRSMSDRSIFLGATPMAVTKSLQSALLHLRDDTKARILWIDALCINQEDLEERRWQVQLMDQIYSGAFQVVVWFDQNQAGRENAIEVIRSLGSDSNLHWTELPLNRSFSLLDLCVILKDAWWTRIWTVQEAVLAQQLSFQRGKTCLSGQTLFNFAKSYNEHIRIVKCCSRLTHSDPDMTRVNVFGNLDSAMDNVMRLRQVQLMSRNSEFDRVASLFRDRKATDPLDKVYGLLGISRGIEESSIDYTLSKTEAYRLSARDCISQNKNLNILSHVIHHTNDTRGRLVNRVSWRKGEPSWVPDWTNGDARPGSDVELIRYRTAFLQHYNASGALESQALPYYSGSELHVDGVCCDVIATVSESFLKRTMFKAVDVIKEWRNILGIEKDPSRSYVGEDTLSEAFWRTLCLDITVSAAAGDSAALTRRADADDRATYLVYWYTALRDHGRVTFKRDDVDFAKRFGAFNDHVNKSIARRQFFVSQKGYIGLGPLGTEPGDRICVLAGGKAPFIVRAAQEGEGEASDRYVCRLLGDSYVHGLMDGEALKLVQEGAAKIEGFELI